MYFCAKFLEIMTREEFSAMCKQFRENVAHASLSDVWRISGFQPSQTIRIEKARLNYNMGNTLKYLEAIGAELIIQDDGNELTVLDYNTLAKWLKSKRGEKSQKELTDDLHIANGTIGKIELGNTKMTIDIFLSLANFFNCQILIKPKT